MAKIRAMWLPKVAKAIGWRPNRLRRWLNLRGIKSPFTSEAKVLQELTNAGISLKSYVPAQDAVGVKFVPYKKTVPGTATNGDSAPAPAAPAERTGNAKHGSWTDRLLISRLARLLPEGSTKQGKSRVSYMLKKAGYKSIKNLDETIALDVLEKAGVSTAGFEYEKKLGEVGGPLVAAPAENYKALLEQYREMGERLKKAVGERAERDKKILELQQLAERARRGLQSYEVAILPIAVKKFGGLVFPLKHPLDVLEWLREYNL